MPTAIIFLAIGRNEVILQDQVARRAHLCRLPNEAAFPVFFPGTICSGRAQFSGRRSFHVPPYLRSASSLFSSGSSCALFRIESLSNSSVACLLQCQARAASSYARAFGTGLRGFAFVVMCPPPGLHDGLALRSPQLDSE
jgi:hypothetical protein